MSNSTQQKNTWEEEFDEYVNEIRRDTHWGDEIHSPNEHFFGGRFQNETKDEVFTAPDWGNIKNFISSLLSQAITEEKEVIIKKILDIKWLSDDGDAIHVYEILKFIRER